jgi:hypothetical protein
MMKRRLTVAVAVITGTVAVGLVGCSTPGPVQIHGSRTELYDSVQGIAADSSLVAVVDVRSQEVIKAASDRDIPYTLSTVSLVDTFSPTGLAKELPKGVDATAIPEGSEIVVRQMGTSEVATPAPILKPGGKYLLFLTPSMLEGDAASQFYVVGGSAGVFEAPSDVASRGEGAEFTHGPFEEGDTLPETLTAKDLTQ